MQLIEERRRVVMNDIRNGAKRPVDGIDGDNVKGRDIKGRDLLSVLSAFGVAPYSNNANSAQSAPISPARHPSKCPSRRSSVKSLRS
jgi:hypothetical protein